MRYRPVTVHPAAAPRTATGAGQVGRRRCSRLLERQIAAVPTFLMDFVIVFLSNSIA